MKQIWLTLLLLALAVTWLLLSPAMVQAAAPCNSTASGNWNISGNWDCGQVPTTSHNVVISNTHTITLTAAADAQSVTIDSGATLNSQTNTLSLASGGAITNSGTFNANSGTVVFSGTGSINGTIIFNDVTLAGAVDFGTNATVNGSLQLNAGGAVNTNAPTYNSNSTLIYNSANPFTASTEWTAGATTGQGVPYHIQVANGTALDLSSAERTARGNLTIDGGGTLTSSSGNLNLGGNLSNSGTITHSNGTMIFNGSNAQSISGVTTFYNLTIDNTAASPNNSTDVDPTAAITVVNTLTINDGQFQPADGSFFQQDVTINNNGILRPDNNASLTVKGNWTNNGTFTHQNSTIIFDKTGSQTFSGSSTFNHVTVETNSTLQLAASANFGYAGTFTLNGSFDPTSNTPTTVTIAGSSSQTLPASATALRNLVINSGATLQSHAGNLNIAGDWTNNGTFTHNNGTVTFNGTAAQGIGGSSNTTFYKLISDNATGVTLNRNSRANHSVTINSGRVLNGGSVVLTLANGATFDSSGATFNANTGRVNFPGSGIVSGTVAFYQVYVGGTVNLGTTPSISNLLRLNSSASLTSGVPTYGNASTLLYYSNASRVPGLEWTAGASSGPGVPANVTLNNNTTLNLGSANWTLSDTLTINSGSTFSTSTGIINIGNDWANNGTFSASTSTVNIGGNWTNNGTFNHNNGTISFNGTSGQAIAGSQAATFYNLTITNSTSSPSDSTDVDPTAAISVVNLLTVEDGQFQPHTGSSFKDISTNSNGFFKPDSGADLDVSGNWVNNSNNIIPNDGTLFFNGLTTISGSSVISFYQVVISSTHTLTGHNLSINVGANFTNNGTFNHNDGTVRFNGTVSQTLTGTFTFYNLTIDNTAPAPDDNVDVDPVSAVTVENALIVNDGQFQPGYVNPLPSVFKHITINSNGILKPDEPDGRISVSGNWTNNGTFIHNNQRVDFFDGSTILSGTVATAFYDLTIISGTVKATAAISVENQLNVANNSQFQPATNSAFKNVAIFSNGVFSPTLNATFSISGNWTNNGTFRPNSNIAIFNGSGGSQSISGQAMSLRGLVINNAAGIALSADITVTNILTLSNGLLNNNASNNITLNDGSTIYRGAGSLSIAPTFGITVNVHYGGSSGVNSGPELPTSNTILHHLTMSNSGGVSLTTAATVNGDFTANAGTLAVDSHTLTLKGMVYAAGGSLSSAATGTVNYDQSSDGQNVVPGNYGNLTFSNFKKTLPNGETVAIAGTFTPGSATGHTFTNSTIEFNGSTAQTMPAGFNPYYNLSLNNLAGVTGFAGLRVDNLLRVKSGTFSSSSTYNQVQIDNGATLIAMVGSTINISGNLTINGNFMPNNGTVVFGGTTLISGTKPISFNHVTIANSAELTGHTLAINVSGNFINSGTYNHNNGRVVFNGSNPQSLTANTTLPFYNLTVNSGSTLLETVATDNASVSGSLINSGLIRKSKGVSGGSQTFGLTGVGLNVTTLGSFTSLQIDRIGSNHPNASSAIQTGQYWQFTPTGSGYTLDLTLTHTLSDHTNAAVCYYNSSSWDCVRNSSTATSVTRNGVNQLASDWAVGNFDLADLELVKKVNNIDEISASKDEVITYTISVSNTDPSTVTGVKVFDLLPGDVSFLTATSSHGSYNNLTGEWNLSDPISGGGRAVLTIAARVDITITIPLTNTAQITVADQTDLNSSNNQDQAIISAFGPIYLPLILGNFGTASESP